MLRPAEPGPVTAAGLRVVGNALRDGSGQIVVLHGVNISGTEFACDQGGTPENRGWSIDGGQPLDRSQTYQAIAAWHVDAVRVPLNEDCWLGINGVNPAYGGVRYQMAVRDQVGRINQAGMIAVLDLHWTAPGSWAAVAQQPMADADHSILFWRQVAAAYRNDPAVLFDLFNEPFLYADYFRDAGQDPWQCWLEGCSLNQLVSAYQRDANGSATGYTTVYAWRTAGMQELVDAVRSAGAAQPIIVNGLDWANDVSGWWADHPRDPAGQLIIGWHSYPGERCATTSCWEAVVAPLTRLAPILVGETGDSTCHRMSYDPHFLPWADEHSLSYLGWTWNPWKDCDNVLIRDWSGTPSANYGQYFHDHLAATAQPGR